MEVVKLIWIVLNIAVFIGVVFGNECYQTDIYKEQINNFRSTENDVVVNNNENVCSTWSNGYVNTFDGHFYSARGNCTYILTQHCHDSNPDFVITFKRDTDNSSLVYIALNIFGDLVTMNKTDIVVNGIRTDIPYSSSNVDIYAQGLDIVFSSHNIEVFVDMLHAIIQVQLPEKYINKTCGLCGDFNGFKNHNEGFKDGSDDPDHINEILEKYMVDVPGEYCVHSSAPLNPVCNYVNETCRAILESAALANCTAHFNMLPYLEMCEMDSCNCNTTDSMVLACICSTLSEFSKQCAHAELYTGNWRNPEVCEIICPPPMEYNECGSACERACSNLEPGACKQKCVSGCFCPNGTVFDDVGNEGCILPSECQCKYLRSTYSTGSQLNLPCENCTCYQGTWKCTSKPCPGTCSVEGGSHITTFDQRRYTFHGECTYILTQLCNTVSYFSVHGEIKSCKANEFETCLTKIVLVIKNPSIVLVINSDGGVTINSATISFPYIDGNLTVFMPTSFYVIVKASFGAQLEVQLTPIMQAYIYLDRSLFGLTCGLCGNFNDKQADDYILPNGLTVQDLSTFTYAWRSEQTCPNVPTIVIDPCSINIQKDAYASMWCSKINSDDIFANCRELVDPYIYQQNCLYDTCLCKHSEDCMCAVFSSFVRACTQHGIIIDDWREHICTRYTKNCEPPMVYRENVQTCQPTCRSLGEPDKSCTVDFVDIDGCVCSDGMYMTQYGECVTLNECPCFHRGTYSNPGDKVFSNGVECVCHNGKLRCDYSKLQTTNCTLPMVYFNCSVEPPGSQGIECLKSCQNLDVDCYSTECISGCVCPEGMLLSGGKEGCVPEGECTCFHDDVVYNHNEQANIGCNNCTCNNRKWDCPDDGVMADCSIYGEGNFISFDKRQYRFNGPCKYTLVQDFCGSNVDNGTFRIIFENTQCSDTGTTCAKTITITYEDSTILLADGEVNAISEGVEIDSQFEMKNNSLFLSLTFKNGLALIWDKRTALTVKIPVTMQHKVCGMCGNYDGNSNNDFTTRSQLSVEDVIEFGNSWKLPPTCPDADGMIEPCDINYHRKSWAQRQCGIILGPIFKPCHSEVDPKGYYDACVKDSCACDEGGDCECYCTAIAMYAQECLSHCICVEWRTPGRCPVFCDYYNEEGQCEWHYKACGANCMKTCRNPSGNCATEPVKIEGCYPRCPEDTPYYEEVTMKCVSQCGCYDHMGRYYMIGDKIVSCNNCEVCTCTTEGITCEYDIDDCYCEYNGSIYAYNETISMKNIGKGICSLIVCGINGTTLEFTIPCGSAISPQTETSTVTVTSQSTTTVTTPTTTKCFCYFKNKKYPPDTLIYINNNGGYGCGTQVICDHFCKIQTLPLPCTSTPTTSTTLTSVTTTPITTTSSTSLTSTSTTTTVTPPTSTSTSTTTTPSTTSTSTTTTVTPPTSTSTSTTTTPSTTSTSTMTTVTPPTSTSTSTTTTPSTTSTSTTTTVTPPTSTSTSTTTTPSTTSTSTTTTVKPPTSTSTSTTTTPSTTSTSTTTTVTPPSSTSTSTTTTPSTTSTSTTTTVTPPTSTSTSTSTPLTTSTSTTTTVTPPTSTSTSTSTPSTTSISTTTTVTPPTSTSTSTSTPSTTSTSTTTTVTPPTSTSTSTTTPSTTSTSTTTTVTPPASTSASTTTPSTTSTSTTTTVTPHTSTSASTTTPSTTSTSTTTTVTPPTSTSTTTTPSTTSTNTTTTVTPPTSTSTSTTLSTTSTSTTTTVTPPTSTSTSKTTPSTTSTSTTTTVTPPTSTSTSTPSTTSTSTTTTVTSPTSTSTSTTTPSTTLTSTTTTVTPPTSTSTSTTTPSTTSTSTTTTVTPPTSTSTSTTPSTTSTSSTTTVTPPKSTSTSTTPPTTSTSTTTTVTPPTSTSTSTTTPSTTSTSTTTTVTPPTSTSTSTTTPSTTSTSTTTTVTPPTSTSTSTTPLTTSTSTTTTVTPPTSTATSTTTTPSTTSTSTTTTVTPPTSTSTSTTTPSTTSTSTTTTVTPPTSTSTSTTTPSTTSTSTTTTVTPPTSTSTSTTPSTTSTSTTTTVTSPKSTSTSTTPSTTSTSTTTTVTPPTSTSTSTTTPSTTSTSPTTTVTPPTSTSTSTTTPSTTSTSTTTTVTPPTSTSTSTTTKPSTTSTSTTTTVTPPTSTSTSTTTPSTTSTSTTTTVTPPTSTSTSTTTTPSTTSSSTTTTVTPPTSTSTSTTTTPSTTSTSTTTTVTPPTSTSTSTTTPSTTSTSTTTTVTPPTSTSTYTTTPSTTSTSTTTTVTPPTSTSTSTTPSTTSTSTTTTVTPPTSTSTSTTTTPSTTSTSTTTTVTPPTSTSTSTTTPSTTSTSPTTTVTPPTSTSTSTTTQSTTSTSTTTTVTPPTSTSTSTTPSTTSTSTTTTVTPPTSTSTSTTTPSTTSTSTTTTVTPPTSTSTSTSTRSTTSTSTTTTVTPPTSTSTSTTPSTTSTSTTTTVTPPTSTSTSTTTPSTTSTSTTTTVAPSTSTSTFTTTPSTTSTSTTTTVTPPTSTSTSTTPSTTSTSTTTTVTPPTSTSTSTTTPSTTSTSTTTTVTPPTSTSTSTSTRSTTSTSTTTTVTPPTSTSTSTTPSTTSTSTTTTVTPPTSTSTSTTTPSTTSTSTTTTVTPPTSTSTSTTPSTTSTSTTTTVTPSTSTSTSTPSTTSTSTTSTVTPPTSTSTSTTTPSTTLTSTTTTVTPPTSTSTSTTTPSTTSTSTTTTVTPPTSTSTSTPSTTSTSTTTTVTPPTSTSTATTTPSTTSTSTTTTVIPPTSTSTSTTTPSTTSTSTTTTVTPPTSTSTSTTTTPPTSTSETTKPTTASTTSSTATSTTTELTSTVTTTPKSTSTLANPTVSTTTTPPTTSVTIPQCYAVTCPAGSMLNITELDCHDVPKPTNCDATIRVYDTKRCCFIYTCAYCYSASGGVYKPDQTWKEGCQQCTCTINALKMCQPIPCPATITPNCKQGYEVMKVENPDNPCCLKEICVCNTNLCNPIINSCRRGYKPIITSNGCCITITCVPETSTTKPTTTVTKSAATTKGPQTSTTKATITTESSTTTTAPPTTITETTTESGHSSRQTSTTKATITTESSATTTVGTSSRTTVTSTPYTGPKGVCIDNDVVYKAGSMMPSPEACQHCICSSIMDTTTQLNIVVCMPTVCDEKCAENEQYEIAPGECCGKCVQNACYVTTPSGETKLLMVDESWAPKNESCTIYKCVKEAEGQLIISVTNQTCEHSSEDVCADGQEYMPPSEGQCCGACVQTRCVLIFGLGSFSYLAEGQSMASPFDNCTTYICLIYGGQLIIVEEKKTCQVNSSEDCKVGEEYVPPTDECCGECVQKYCVMTTPNGGTELLKEGESVPASNDSCTTYKCVMSGEQLVTVVEKKTCQVNSSKDCKVGEEYLPPTDECCGECVQIYCVMTTPNGDTVLLNEGEFVTFPNDSCATHKCVMSGEQLSIVEEIKTCQVNSSEECKLGEEYVPPTDQCCGKCVQNQCVMTTPIGEPILLNEGQSVPAPDDNCTSYKCVKSHVQLVTVAEKVNCQVNSSEDCKFGEEYVPPTDQCCGECVQKYCVMTTPNGETELLNEGKYVSFPSDNCTHYQCVKTAEQLTTVEIKADCQYHSSDDCKIGEEYVPPTDQCCGECVQKYCVMTAPNGEPELLSEGESVSSPNNSCTSYKCVMSGEQLVTIEKKVTCQIDSSADCKVDEEYFRPTNQCCGECVKNACSFVMLNGYTVNLNPGETTGDTQDVCTNYTCTEVNGQLIGEIEKQNCKIQSAADCQPGENYTAPVNECCGKCVQIQCSIIMPSGKIANLKPGESSSAATDKCVTYECREVDGTLYPMLYNKSCDNVTKEDCETGTIKVSDDGCCSKCIAPKPCGVEVGIVDLLTGDCPLTLSIPYCSGVCTYPTMPNAMEPVCKCCQILQSRKESMEVACKNGTTITHEYDYIENCGCSDPPCA